MSFTGPIEERLAVRELIEDYADAVTQRDARAWAELWEEDAVWLMPDLGSGISLSGKSTIVSSWMDMMAQYHGSAEDPLAFSFAAVLGAMQITGDRAVVRSYSVEAFADKSGRTVHLKGQYDDEVIKREGRWRFAKRVWRLMPLEDHAEMSAS